MGMAIRKGTWKYVGTIFMVQQKTSVWCIYIGAVHILVQHKISHPVLVLEASPSNIGVFSWVGMLPSHHTKGNSSLGTFNPLEKLAIMFNLVNWLTFGLVCAILHCLVVASAFSGLQSIYTISFGLEICTPLLLCVGTLPKILYLNYQLLSWNNSFGQLEPNYCLFKLCYGKTLKISLWTL